jgi:C1A family cysteine protease
MAARTKRKSSAKPSGGNQWYGWLPDRPDHRDKLYQAIAKAPKRLPASVDLRELCSKVEDQGNLGSCTANALVGNLEFLEKQAGKRPINLSRLFVYYNERAIEGTVNEDAGAFIRDGIKTLVKNGVCPETEWRYLVRKFREEPPKACYDHAEKHQVLSYHRITTLREMKMCLAEGYPFVFGFTVYDAFESAEVAKTGRLDLPKPGESDVGGHAVMAVGYDEAKQRFLIRNSWGTDWGLDGYFTMPYDYLDNRNLSDDFWTIRAFEQ